MLEFPTKHYFYAKIIPFVPNPLITLIFQGAGTSEYGIEYDIFILPCIQATYPRYQSVVLPLCECIDPALFEQCYALIYLKYF